MAYDSLKKPGRNSAASHLERIDCYLKITKPIRENYKTYLDYYRGHQHKIKTFRTDDFDPIVVNYTFNTIRTMVPTLYFKNPRMFAHATRAEFLDRVPLVNTISNYDLRILNVKQQIKRSILRSLIGGMAWVENSYSFIEEEQKEEIGPDDLFIPLEEEDKDQKLKFSDPRIKTDSPIIISRSIMEIALDPWANQMDEISWYAIKEILPLNKVKKDPRYKATKNLKANAHFDSIVVNSFSDEFRKKGETDFVELWHITDRWEGRTFTVARDHSSKLREFDTPEGYDLVPIIFNEDPESNEQISIISVFRDQQDEINRFRQYMVEHIRRTLPRMIADSDKITDEEKLNRITESDADEVIPVPGGASSLQPLNFPNFSPDLYRVQDSILDDMRIGSGLTDFQRGQAVKTPSATEAQIIEQSSRLRVDEGLDIISDVVERVMKNAFQLRQKFTTGEKAALIIGDNNLPIWNQVSTYNRDMIQGDYEFAMDYGSTQKKDQDHEKNQWMQLAPIITSLVAQAQQLPQLAVLGRALMQVFERPQPEIDQLFPPTPAPQGLPAFNAPQDQGFGIGTPNGVNPEQLIALLGGGR